MNGNERGRASKRVEGREERKKKGKKTVGKRRGSGKERERKGSPHTSFPGERLNPGQIQTTEFPL